MNNVWDILSAIRSTVRFEEMPSLLLVEAAHKLGKSPEMHGNSSGMWKRFSRDSSYPQLQAAAQTLLRLHPNDRLAALDVVFENSLSGKEANLWIDRPAAQQIAKIFEGASSVRCSFGWALHPALHVGVEAEAAGRNVELFFGDLNPEICDIAALAAVALEIDLTVFLGQPFERLDGVKAEAEISLPPFGWKLQDTSVLPRKTLEWLGATQAGRLTAEPIAIADILAHAPNAHAVLGLSAGPLFRMVGVEVAAREELINSGRLEAVFDVPSGMVYQETGIATGFLVLSPSGKERDSVRFVDLGHEHFSVRGSRGRYEARTDTSWVKAIASAGPEVDYIRDASLVEIEEQGRILTPSRYLSRTATKISAFNERYEVRGLADLVELIRPAALPKAEEGDYLVHEAAPGDVGEDGFLKQPPKTTQVDRGGLRKARNQQVEPGDVLISVKGTIGRVGLVPETVPDRNADIFWTAGQSMMILRPRGSLIASEVLYEYLSSDLMHEHLNTLSGGSVIQAFNMKDLKTLPIPVPSKDDQDRIREEFAQRQMAFRSLEQLRKEIEAMKSECWPHRELKEGDDG